jgi:hypothetical protein
VRRAILIALAAGALSGLGASSAFAGPPEFGRCVKVAKGAGVYATGKCTTEGGEKKFEWIPGPGPKPGFTIALKEANALFFETTGGTRLMCTGETGTGEITGTATIGNVTMALRGCESGSLACNSEGAAKGEVVLVGYTGSLGVVKASEPALKDKIGLSLSGSTPFACGGGVLAITISGAGIGTISPTDGMTVKRTWKFTAKNGRQNPERFEGGLMSTFTWAGPGPEEQAALSSAFTFTSAEKVEINTIV